MAANPKDENIEAFPLYWPEGRPRTKSRERSRFRPTFYIATRALFAELDRLGAREAILSTNVPLRGDGMPYASAKPPSDPGAAVYFRYKGQAMCFACDRWDRVADNVHAIRLTIGALRGVARWGTGDMMAAAFKGFVALPAPGAKKTWREVLGIKAEQPTRSEIEKAYRRLRSVNHPDKLGNSDDFHEITTAFQQAMEEIA